MPDDLLSIGNFALISGLSIHALRHYDDVGVLNPAWVDPATGYRRYRPGQASDARLLAILRRLDVPIETMRAVLADRAALPGLLTAHRDLLLNSAARLTEIIDNPGDLAEKGSPMKGSRITQVTIAAPDLPASIAFYRTAFGAEFLSDINSFQFGTYPDDDFFLLTVADPEVHPWPGGPAKLGLLVPDLETAHARALTAGATEVCPPQDRPWKPRSSCVADPADNHIDLYQG